MPRDWDSEGEAPHSRRYSSRGPRALPYDSSQDRYQHNTQPDGLRYSPGGYNLLIHDPQHGDHDLEQDTKANRKRIPVACGRCRKRKIRCSGPQGDTGCLNCKNAGNSDCQFNRVASQEMLLHNTAFTYNPDLARAVHAREPRGNSQTGPSHYRPGTPSYIYGPGLEPPLSYRNHPISDFHHHQSKPFLSLPSLNYFGGDNPVYTLSGTTFPLDPEHVGGLSTYSSRGTSRACISGTQPAKGSANAVYFDSDAAVHAQSPTYFSNQTCGLRSSIGNESNHFSLTGMASSLPIPSPVTVNDRILPPVQSRFNPMLAPMHRAMDELSDGGSTIKAIGSHDLAVSQLMTGGQSSPSNYLEHSGNTGSADSYNPNSLSGGLNQQQPDLYSSTDNWTTTALATDPALSSEGPSSDLYPSYCNDGPRKASQVDQNGVRMALSNGHSHQAPYHPDTSHVPRSDSIAMSRGLSQRRTSGGLHAA